MFTPPSFGSIRFSCPHCGALAHQYWSETYANALEKDKIPPRFQREAIEAAIANQEGLPPAKHEWSTNELLDFLKAVDGNVFLSSERKDPYSFLVYNLEVSRCDSCNDIAVWLSDKIVYPPSGPSGVAAQDMPSVVQSLFDEAGAVFATSPRAAAAILRLALQHLLKELGQTGKDINADINSLIDLGLDADIAKQMHALRIIGNESVHPGQIDVNDEPYIAEALFDVLNQIVEQMITRPRKREELWKRLPEGKRKQVEDRLSKRSDKN
jgi:hypothetical protein